VEFTSEHFATTGTNAPAVLTQYKPSVIELTETPLPNDVVWAAAVTAELRTGQFVLAGKTAAVLQVAQAACAAICAALSSSIRE